MKLALYALALCLLATPALAQGFEITDGDTIKAPWGESFRLGARVRHLTSGNITFVVAFCQSYQRLD